MHFEPVQQIMDPSDDVLQALRRTPRGSLSYSPKWDRSSEVERRELLTEFTSPTPLSPDTVAYLTERTRRLSLQLATTASSEGRSSPPSASGLSASHHVHNRHHSMPDTPLHNNRISVTPKSTLKLVIEGDSPPVSPIATSPESRLPEAGQGAMLNSTLHYTAVTKTMAISTPHVMAISTQHVTTVIMEMPSVLDEQEAELVEQEQRQEDQLQEEAMERLRERISYIKREEERIAQEAQEALVQQQARRRREEEMKKAIQEASEMQWKQKIDHDMERLSESYRQHGEELEAKLREGEEQKREIAKRVEERKKQALQRLHQRCVAMRDECASLLQKLNTAISSCSYPHLLPEAAMKAHQNGCQLLMSVQSSLGQQLKSGTPDEKQIAVLHSCLTSVHPLVAEVNSGVEEATQKGQQEEKDRKKQEQEQKEQQQHQQQQQKQQQQQESQQKISTKPPLVSAPSSSQKTPCLSATPIGMPSSMLKLYSELQGKLMQITTACDVLSKNAQVKKYRFDLQKAISTPINAISGHSGEHLLDKIRRLRAVLSGQRVQVTGRQVSAGDHPQGRNYCMNLLAQKIVKQGDEQVSSRSEAAFPVAGVTISLCVSFPELSDLVLAHFHASCPVLVPFYAKNKELSDAERYRLLGYKVSSDGQVEGEDNYLKRMSGIVRLYAAILQTPSEPHTHPHGLEHGWAWFARVLNMEPHPTLTATAIYDMLEIAGYALMKAYGRQFQKMLYYMCKQYIPCVERITPVSQQGPLARLKLFLEKCVSSGRIPQPKGTLNDDFWRAHSHGIATA